MKTLYVEDLAASVTAALQQVSHTHPADFVAALKRARDRETQPAARGALEQLLVNSRMSRQARRPVCQDTGIANVYLKLGVEVRLATKDGNAVPGLRYVIDEAVGRAYTDPDNPLRATVVADPLGRRRNTRNNAPGLVHVELVAGDAIEVVVAAKGGGGDVKARYKVLTPSDSIVDWILNEIPTLGAGWCPPGVIGIGVGGAGPDETMRLAKEALYTPIDIDGLLAKGAETPEESLRVELYQRINDLKIGAQGLGGDTTVLDVKVASAPCHAAMLPVALIPNCAATRFVRFSLDGQGPARFEAEDETAWDDIPDQLSVPDGIRVDLRSLAKGDVAGWRRGQTLLLNGALLTARDAAHKRLHQMLERGDPLPVDLRDRVLFYVGPVDAVRDEVIGPAGPTTSARMDGYLDEMMGLGLLATVGKAERTQPAVDAIRRHRGAYLVAVGGAAYLASRCIVASRVVAFEDLGMEAIYEFEVRDFPVTVGVDATGASLHRYIPIRSEY